MIDFSEKGTSVSKGETLIDTARNIEAMGVDIIVIRHPAAGAAELLARTVKCSVVNAGDGAHEHPTQGLLDLYTIRERFGKIAGLKVAIVGDIANSRVARSNLWGLTKLGAEVILVGPPTLVPRAFRSTGRTVVHDFDSIIGEVDVINMLRVQFERIKSSQFPVGARIHALLRPDAERFARCKHDVFVMHPGPMNRGIEISSDIADGPQSGILTQVTNGLAVRMAVLVSGDAGAMLRSRDRRLIYAYPLIQNGTILDPSQKLERRADLLIRDGKIAGIGSQSRQRRSRDRRHRLLRHARPDRHSRPFPRAGR